MWCIIWIIRMVAGFVSRQCTSWFASFSTNSTRNEDPKDMISFYVAHYTLHASLLSTHLAYSCSSHQISSILVGSRIITEYHHWLHLLSKLSMSASQIEEYFLEGWRVQWHKNQRPDLFYFESPDQVIGKRRSLGLGHFWWKRCHVKVFPFYDFTFAQD